MTNFVVCEQQQTETSFSFSQLAQSPSRSAASDMGRKTEKISKMFEEAEKIWLWLHSVCIRSSKVTDCSHISHPSGNHVKQARQATLYVPPTNEAAFKTLKIQSVLFCY